MKTQKYRYLKTQIICRNFSCLGYQVSILFNLYQIFVKKIKKNKKINQADNTLEDFKYLYRILYIEKHKEKCIKHRVSKNNIKHRVSKNNIKHRVSKKLN